MVKKILLFNIVIMFSFSLLTEAQIYKHKYNVRKPTANDKFLKTQWWLGFKAGANLTKAMPETRYSGLSPTNYSSNQLEKEYAGFDKLGGQAGLEITFYHQGFSFSLQPYYRRQRVSYSNNYEWVSSENTANTLTLKYDQDHLLDYIELPLLIKYDIMKSSKVRPFIQIGAYYGTLVNANKNIEISGTDFASGSAGPFENQSQIIGAKALFTKSSVGLIGGAGFSYDFWNVRLVIDASYRYGLNNITNVKNRYSENQLSGIGDALDDMKLRNLSFNIGCLFPMRFISNQGNNAVK
ncbi:MAG TPA: porin family protein [Fulvivirga sp.]|nr:porin family protein [Fulvivirga sp.]